MKKIELEIVALSHSITQSNSYAVILGEVNGLRRLPIVIGGFEAQAIAVALENMHPSRPLTHDLMKNFMTAFDIQLQEVYICDLQEGIFYSKLVCFTANDTIEIDSRTIVLANETFGSLARRRKLDLTFGNLPWLVCWRNISRTKLHDAPPS